MSDEVKTVGFWGECKQLASKALAWERAHQRKIAMGVVFALSHPDKVRDGVKAITAALITMFGLGCASTAQYVPSETRLACYLQADHSASARVDAECGGHLAGCPVAVGIKTQLKAALAACK